MTEQKTADQINGPQIGIAIVNTAPLTRIEDLEQLNSNLRRDLSAALAESLRKDDSLKEAKMAEDFADAATENVRKQLAELQAILAWASDNVSWVGKNPARSTFKDCPFRAYSIPSDQGFDAPTLLSALTAAYQNREVKS